MATSGSTDYSQTRDDIIKRALRLMQELLRLLNKLLQIDVTSGQG